MSQKQSIKNSDCHHDHPMMGQWVTSLLYSFFFLRSETFRKANNTNLQATMTFLTRKIHSMIKLMANVFFAIPQMPALTHSSPLPSIPFVQPDPPASPFQARLLPFSLTQECPTLQKRFISKPKTCKGQGIDHFAFLIPPYLKSPYTAHLHD